MDSQNTMKLNPPEHQYADTFSRAILREFEEYLHFQESGEHSPLEVINRKCRCYKAINTLCRNTLSGLDAELNRLMQAQIDLLRAIPGPSYIPRPEGEKSSPDRRNNS